MSLRGTCVAILAWILFLKGIALGHEFMPPSADQVVAFANNPKFKFVSGFVLEVLPKERLVEFLEHGKVLPGNLPAGDPAFAGYITFSGDLTPLAKAEVAIEGARQKFGTTDLFLICRGVAATRGTIYFWELINDDILWLGDGAGNSCYLKLGVAK